MTTKRANLLIGLANRVSAPQLALAILLIVLTWPVYSAIASNAELSWPSDMTERTDLIPEDRKRVEQVTRPTRDFSTPEGFENMSGGATTSTKIPNQDAFSHFAANLTFEEEEFFKLGNALFRKLWVSSPSSTQASDGLGPLFNARSCQSCHLKDGRGHPPERSGDANSMFLRLAREAATTSERADLRISRPNCLIRYGGNAEKHPGLRDEHGLILNSFGHTTPF